MHDLDSNLGFRRPYFLLLEPPVAGSAWPQLIRLPRLPFLLISELGYLKEVYQWERNQHTME